MRSSSDVKIPIGHGNGVSGDETSAESASSSVFSLFSMSSFFEDEISKSSSTDTESTSSTANADGLAERGSGNVQDSAPQKAGVSEHQARLLRDLARESMMDYHSSNSLLSLEPTDGGLIRRAWRSAFLRFSDLGVERYYDGFDNLDMIETRAFSVAALLLALVFQVLVNPLRFSFPGNSGLAALSACFGVLNVMMLLFCITVLLALRKNAKRRVPLPSSGCIGRITSRQIAFVCSVLVFLFYNAQIVVFDLAKVSCMSRNDDVTLGDCKIGRGVGHDLESREGFERISLLMLPIAMVMEFVWLLNIVISGFFMWESVVLLLFYLVLIALRPLVRVLFFGHTELLSFYLGYMSYRFVIFAVCLLVVHVGDRYRRLHFRTVFSNSELTEISSFLKTKLAVISHEIKTPLHVNRLGLGALDEANLTSGEQLALDAAKDANALAQNIVEGVLLSTAIEKGLFQLREKEVYLEEMLLSTVRSLRRLARDRGLAFECIIRAGCPKKVVCDSGRVSQGIWNLVSNAVKFTESGSILVSALLNTNDFVEIQVTDSGPGLKEGSEHTLFDRFAKDDVGQTADGIGLGLSVMRDLVDAWGGNIWCHNREDSVRGAVFHFTFPHGERKVSSSKNFRSDKKLDLQTDADQQREQRDGRLSTDQQDGPAFAPSSEDASTRGPANSRVLTTFSLSSMESSATESEPAGFDASNNTILVVDDNIMIRRLFFRQLEKFRIPKCSVVALSDGAECIRYWRNHRAAIRLILMDQNMPGISGSEATLAIREHEGRARKRGRGLRKHDSFFEPQRVPIICLSAADDLLAEDSFHDCGFDGFMCKPINNSVLEATLDRVFGGTIGSISPTLQAELSTSRSSASENFQKGLPNRGGLRPFSASRANRSGSYSDRSTGTLQLTKIIESDDSEE